MDKLKIFVSSTCFDSKELRETLCKSIVALGHEPIVSESSLYYKQNQTAENSCYDGVINSDIVIHIIGKSFGSPASMNAQYSVAQMELKTAISKRKNRYIFIPTEVQSDYNTYIANNRKTKGIKYPNVVVKADKVFSFIDYVYSENMPVFPYSTLEELIGKLKDHLSALFRERLNNKEVYAQDYFTQSYTQLSSEFYNDIQECSNLSIIGLGQKRMIATLASYYSGILQRNGRIDVILTDPDGASTIMCAKRSSTNRGDIPSDIAIHKDTINRLLDIKNQFATSGIMKIFIADFMFPYTMYAFNTNDISKTKIYVWITPLFEPSSSRLGFLLKGSTDCSEIESFLRQFSELINNGETKEILTKYL